MTKQDQLQLLLIIIIIIIITITIIVNNNNNNNNNNNIVTKSSKRDCLSFCIQRQPGRQWSHIHCRKGCNHDPARDDCAPCPCLHTRTVLEMVLRGATSCPPVISISKGPCLLESPDNLADQTGAAFHVLSCGGPQHDPVSNVASYPLGVELPWSPEPIMCSFRSRKALKQPPFSVHVQWPGDFHRKAMDLAVIASLLMREQRVSERLVAFSHPVPVPFLVASGHFSW